MFLITLQYSMYQPPLSTVVASDEDVLPALRRMVDHDGATEMTPDEWAGESIDLSDDWSVVKLWCGIDREVELQLSKTDSSPASNGEASLDGPARRSETTCAPRFEAQDEAWER